MADVRTVQLSWRGPALVAAVVAGLLLLGTVAMILLRALAPSDGSVVDAGDNALPNGQVVVQSITANDGLRVGDRIIAIDGQDLSTIGVPGARPANQPGDVLSYQVIRDGQTITVPVRLAAFPYLRQLAENWPTLALDLALVAVSGFLFVRRPSQPAVHAAVISAACAMFTGAASGYPHLEAVDLVAGVQFWRWTAGELAYAVLWGMILHFAVAFPILPNRPHVRRWLVLGYVGPLLMHACLIGYALITRRTGLALLSFVASPALAAQLIYPTIVLVVLIVKYRMTAENFVRRRLRWLAGSLGLAGALYVGLWAIPVQIHGSGLLPDSLHPLVFLPVPIMVALAVLLDGALDLNIAVSRSMVYVVQVVVAAAMYATAAGLITLLRPNDNRFWTQVIAVTLVAVLVHPIRARSERWINLRFFGNAVDPYRVMSVLATQLQTTPTPSAMLPGIVEAIGIALRLPHVAIELVRGETTETAASFGKPTASLLRLPITYQNERVGFLVAAARSNRDDFTSRDRQLLADIAGHAGAVTEAVRLTNDLQYKGRELIRAREEERRRLLRDLHDGVGSQLAAVSLGLQAARSALGTDPDGAGRLLGRLSTELTVSIAEIRRVAYDLRPPVLDQLGLTTAVREYAATLSRGAANGEPATPLTVVLDMPDHLPTLPAAVEVAAYRIICEALTNVARHGRTDRCAVKIRMDSGKADGGLQLEVLDDGLGVPRKPRYGVGLASMRERAAEVGGTCTIEPRRPRGTVVRAVLPVGTRRASA
ncbi:MAG TPA: histidine kinase [Pseudonocardiaceae bacterium]|nr:histidine kinase [Pseudonocardiaceae bacterium]